MTDNNYSDIQDLISLELAGQTSASEKKYLHDLIQNDEAVRKIWEERSTYHASMAHAYESVNRQAAWKGVASRTISRRRPVYRAIAVAAAACVVAVISVYTFYPSKHTQTFDHSAAHLTLANGEVIDLRSPQKNIAIPNGATVSNVDRSLSYTGGPGSGEMNELWAPAGSDYKIELSDGTEIWLNSMTRLRFPFQFTGNTREIAIEGEAYIKVAKDAAKPFIVHLPSGDVTVLGTAFNVNTYERTAVALVQGSVQVKMQSQTILLKPGEQAVYDGSLITNKFEREEVLSWMEGLHMFNNASLAEIVKVLPRWYGVEVVLDDASTAQSRFTGYIDRKRPISEFLHEIKATTEADYYYKDGVLHFR
ncbi:FecR family protein [Chitinophaga niabensis]|uniref:FecR protein n=1 Tax=Chitinophaga niabensis TaxID=536979 RepID=A0A1N6JCC5_9BACT|nr:FecR domain-containing protein [Chitinophaga niabensis]SIO41766.1 FecR protein [Chitinophaga niabensis]